MAYEPSQSEIDRYGYVRAKIRANNNPRGRGRRNPALSGKELNQFAQQTVDRYVAESGANLYPASLEVGSLAAPNIYFLAFSATNPWDQDEIDENYVAFRLVKSSSGYELRIADDSDNPSETLGRKHKRVNLKSLAGFLAEALFI